MGRPVRQNIAPLVAIIIIGAVAATTAIAANQAAKALDRQAARLTDDWQDQTKRKRLLTDLVAKREQELIGASSEQVYWIYQDQLAKETEVKKQTATFFIVGGGITALVAILALRKRRA